MMRVIVLDTKKLEVREEFWTEGRFLEQAYKAIGCFAVDCVRYEDDIDIWCDDEGLFADNGEPKRWCYFPAMLGANLPENWTFLPEGTIIERTPGAALAGSLVITGGPDSEGNTKATGLSMETVKKMFVFVVKP